MSNIPKGGRGYKAPYKTTHRRIPLEIKPEVEMLIERYRKAVMSGEDYIPSIHKDKNSLKVILPYEDALKLARKIMRQKQSARKSLAKLVSALYSVTCSPEEL